MRSPVHVVRWSGGAWFERKVDWQDGQFVWIDSSRSPAKRCRLMCALSLRTIPDGYTTEVNLLARSWLSGVAPKLQRGWVLAIDYGFPPRGVLSGASASAWTLSAYLPTISALTIRSVRPAIST